MPHGLRCCSPSGSEATGSLSCCDDAPGNVLRVRWHGFHDDCALGIEVYNVTLLVRYEDLRNRTRLPALVAAMLRFVGVAPNASRIACGVDLIDGQTRGTWGRHEPPPFGAARVTLREALAADVARTRSAWGTVKRYARRLGYVSMDPHAPARGVSPLSVAGVS